MVNSTWCLIVALRQYHQAKRPDGKLNLVPDRGVERQYHQAKRPDGKFNLVPNLVIVAVEGTVPSSEATRWQTQHWA